MDMKKYTERAQTIQKLSEDLNASLQKPSMDATFMPVGKIAITTAIIVIGLIVFVSYWGVSG